MPQGAQLSLHLVVEGGLADARRVDKAVETLRPEGVLLGLSELAWVIWSPGVFPPCCGCPEVSSPEQASVHPLESERSLLKDDLQVVCEGQLPHKLVVANRIGIIARDARV